MKKLSFTIDNVQMIEENPESNFALLSLDYFASGDNLHDLYVSEETLMRTADSIKNCPLVWKYDEVLDDSYTHDPDEVPCGFVPENSAITTKKLEDGRTMLSVVARVWKRYTGPLLSFFKRDGGKKPVSVEMSVYKTKPLSNGKTELLDYRYEGITVLGTYVTPAIPLAQASILSFAEEYEEDYEKEFSLEKIIIPTKIRYNAEKGLELSKEKTGTSTGLAMGHFLTKNKVITQDKVREIANYFSTHKHGDRETDWFLWGGDYAKEWAENMSLRIDKELLTFPYKSKSEMNPALKGITPPVSLAQANAIANQADSIGSDEKKNGWAIAISSFKKTHHVEDGKWVKNKGSTAQASAEPTLEQLEYWDDVIEEEFAAEDMGKGEAIQVNKSKDGMSDSGWGNVDKTSLMHKVLNASNYKSLVHDVYLVVEEGWEEHPSSSLKYPVMQISGGKAVYNRGGLANALSRAQGQGETGVVSKINALYNKLGLNSDKKEMAMTEEELAKMAAEEEAKKKAAEEEAIKKFAEEEEAKKKAAEEEANKKVAEEEAKKKFADEEEANKKALEEKKFQLETLSKFFSDDQDADDEEVKMAKAEIEKCDAASFSPIVKAAYAKYCKMQEMCKNMAEEKKAYMAENEELKKFKAELEAQQKNFAVEETLKDISVSVILPDEVRAELRAEAEKYTLENIGVWKNYCKAKSFDFAIRQPKTNNIIDIGLPFTGATKKPKGIWDE